MKQLVDGLDLEVPQVQIEARIVQADTTYSRSLGVQWGIQNVNQLAGGGGGELQVGYYRTIWESSIKFSGQSSRHSRWFDVDSWCRVHDWENRWSVVGYTVVGR